MCCSLPIPYFEMPFLPNCWQATVVSRISQLHLGSNSFPKLIFLAFVSGTPTEFWVEFWFLLFLFLFTRKEVLAHEQWHPMLEVKEALHSPLDVLSIQGHKSGENKLVSKYSAVAPGLHCFMGLFPACFHAETTKPNIYVTCLKTYLILAVHSNSNIFMEMR